LGDSIGERIGVRVIAGIRVVHIRVGRSWLGLEVVLEVSVEVRVKFEEVG